MSFSSLDWDILISSFQKILSPFSNFPLWKTFEVWNCENMENTLKIKEFIKSIMFCTYLRNGGSDLYEILCGGQLLSCELKFHEDADSNARAQVVNARTCDKTCTCVFTTHMCAFILSTTKLVFMIIFLMARSFRLSRCKE